MAYVKTMPAKVIVKCNTIKKVVDIGGANNNFNVFANASVSRCCRGVFHPSRQHFLLHQHHSGKKQRRNVRFMTIVFYRQHILKMCPALIMKNSPNAKNIM